MLEGLGFRVLGFASGRFPDGSMKLKTAVPTTIAPFLWSLMLWGQLIFVLICPARLLPRLGFRVWGYYEPSLPP